VLVLVAGVGACQNDGSAPSSNGTPPTASSPPPVGSVPTPPTSPSSPAPAATPAPAQLTCAPCTRIAFTSSRDGNDEIYTVNADGTGLTRLTDDASSDDYAVWSSDGHRIAFTSQIGGDSKLVVMNADGSNVVRHALPHSVWHPTWSPDGTRITYSALSDGSLNIWTVDADGGWPVLLFSERGWDGQPSWSPDGTKLALVSDWFAYDFGFDVFLVDPDGVGFTALTDGNIFDPIEYLWPSWSPDGTKIALTLSNEIGINRYTTLVGVMNHDGTGLRSLIAAAPAQLGDAPWSKVSWSLDGTLIAFTSGSAGALDVSWVKVDGSAWGTIITNGWNPAWQP
jgi:Tol biopolymer transport system component